MSYIEGMLGVSNWVTRGLLVVMVHLVLVTIGIDLAQVGPELASDPRGVIFLLFGVAWLGRVFLP
jgi:hypothetical protein